MNTQVISRGTKKNGQKTAMIVEKIKNGAGVLVSKTRHLVYSSIAGTFLDTRGFQYDIKG